MMEELTPNKNLLKTAFDMNKICFIFYTRNKEDVFESRLFSLQIQSSLSLSLSTDTGIVSIAGYDPRVLSVGGWGRQGGKSWGVSALLLLPWAVCLPVTPLPRIWMHPGSRGYAPPAPAFLPPVQAW